MGVPSYSTVEDRRLLRQAADAADVILGADKFDAAAVDALSRRSVYAFAASSLVRIIDCPGRGQLVPAFLKPETFAPYRFGVAFGVIPSAQDVMEPYTAADLRALDTPESRLALIALGEPCEWKTLDRVGRAVFVLRRLVQRMRDR